MRKNNAPSSDVQNDDARNIDDDDPHNEDVRRSNGDMRLEKEERWDKDFLKFLEEFASVEKRKGNKRISCLQTEMSWPALALFCKGSLLKMFLMSRLFRNKTHAVNHASSSFVCMNYQSHDCTHSVENTDSLVLALPSVACIGWSV